MAERTFESLAPRVQGTVRGCPYALVVQYIRDAAIRTCERTLAWRYQQPKFDLVPGRYTYLYNKPFDSQVHTLFQANLNDSPLDILTLDAALDLYPAWADNYNSNADIAEFGSEPRAITQISPHQYVVLPLPDAEKTYTLRMFYALRPSKTATGMEEAVFDDLEEVIMHGALQHLLVLPNQSWEDRELAAYHAKQYTFQIAERRARANLGNARGVFRVRMQPFGV